MKTGRRLERLKLKMGMVWKMGLKDGAGGRREGKEKGEPAEKVCCWVWQLRKKKMETHPLSFGCRGEEENPKGLGTVGLCPLLSDPWKMAPISSHFCIAGDEKKYGFS
uniref:Uncharacterized protein n=1 Tax=Populus alba TaxID=43335 RepID=A0A4U5Q1W7_POPAL|nr:hypothetical protein D5086_0000147090 [Populus alba]